MTTERPDSTPGTGGVAQPTSDTSYELVEKIMQSGFDVAMGGTPFEPYDQELAFQKARAENRKLIMIFANRLATERAIEELENLRSNKHSEWTINVIDGRRLELEAALRASLEERGTGQ